MDIGLLILRSVLALILFTHASQKLFGWFGGNGVEKQGELFAALGLRPGRQMVAFAGVSEMLAACLLALGLLTPAAALIGASTMLVAGVTMQLNSGNFWNVAGGGEYPYVLAATAMTLGFTGAGAYSLDAVVARQVDVGYGLVAEPAAWIGMTVVLVSAVAVLPFAAIVRRNKGA